MRKIRLDPEELTVEAFPTSETASRRGTVNAQDSTFDPNSISGWNNCFCPREFTASECTVPC